MDRKRFIRQVAEGCACDEQRADAVTFAVFQELRDRLTPKETADVTSQLPAGLREMWTEGESTERTVHRIEVDEFLGRVRRRLSLPSESEARRAVTVVFHVLQRLLGSADGTSGEAWDVFSQLPKGLKQLWLEAGRG